jgi:glyoxylase-like metal-dependent hydrolase (beta-lactamase superfamily II)
MIIEVFVGGPVETNGYLIADRRGGEAIVIDAPEGTTLAITSAAREQGVTIRYLVNTHPHWDHIQDNAALVRATGAKFGIHADGVPLLSLPQTRMFGLDIEIEPVRPDFFLEDGGVLETGKLKFEILHCPGHCPGGVALFERSESAVFVGDVLFTGSIGRTDLPGGDYDTLMKSIREKLLTLGDDVRVFSGHGPVTTIGAERRRNPFLAP